MPKRSCHHAWLHDSRTIRVNYNDKFTAIRTVAYVLVQSCQPHKHRQGVETTMLCHCGCSVGVSVLFYTLYACCGLSHSRMQVARTHSRVCCHFIVVEHLL
jgi:hypothetical protein